jgi:hypothetical protein
MDIKQLYADRDGYKAQVDQLDARSKSIAHQIDDLRNEQDLIERSLASAAGAYNAVARLISLEETEIAKQQQPTEQVAGAQNSGDKKKEETATAQQPTEA